MVRRPYQILNFAPLRNRPLFGWWRGFLPRAFNGRTGGLTRHDRLAFQSARSAALANRLVPNRFGRGFGKELGGLRLCFGDVFRSGSYRRLWPLRFLNL